MVVHYNVSTLQHIVVHYNVSTLQHIVAHYNVSTLQHIVVHYNVSWYVERRVRLSELGWEGAKINTITGCCRQQTRVTKLL